MKLIRYDAACRAIAAAKQVDEVKKIRDVSVAMRAYARQAGNRGLESDAVEIRMRATRRMDQMRQDQKATVGLAKGTRGSKVKGARVDNKPTLADAGIGKNLAHEGRKLGALTDREFERAVETARESVSRVVKDALRSDNKKERRATRERELGVKQTALPQQVFGVVYADPPWSFAPFSKETGMDRAADNHYPTMSVEKIAAIEVPAADDAVLFLWATAPMLPEALQVMTAWGFTYKSHLIWRKDVVGTGYWARNLHELLLIGVRGKIPAPAPGEQPASVIDAVRGEHSAKPMVFRKLIEDMFPNLPRIELFAREQSDGWAVWGNQLPEAAE